MTFDSSPRNKLLRPWWQSFLQENTIRAMHHRNAQPLRHQRKRSRRMQASLRWRKERRSIFPGRSERRTTTESPWRQEPTPVARPWTFQPWTVETRAANPYLRPHRVAQGDLAGPCYPPQTTHKTSAGGKRHQAAIVPTCASDMMARRRIQRNGASMII